MVGFKKQTCFSSPFKVKKKFEADVVELPEEIIEEKNQSFKKMQAMARDVDGWEDNHEKKDIPGEKLLRKLHKMEQKNMRKSRKSRKSKTHRVDRDDNLEQADVDRISKRLSGIIHRF